MKTLIQAIALATLLAGCGDDAEGTCDENGALQCNGDVLETCDDGLWVEEQDCGSDDMICHETDDSHCMMADIDM